MCDTRRFFVWSEIVLLSPIVACVKCEHQLRKNAQSSQYLLSYFMIGWPWQDARAHACFRCEPIINWSQTAPSLVLTTTAVVVSVATARLATTTVVSGTRLKRRRRHHRYHVLKHRYDARYKNDPRHQIYRISSRTLCQCFHDLVNYRMRPIYSC